MSERMSGELLRSEFGYVVKRQQRKTLVLYVLQDGEVEVRAPHQIPEQEIIRFVESRARWIEQTRARQLQRVDWRAAALPGGDIWFLGESRRLRVERGPAFGVALAAAEFVVSTRDPFNLPALARQLEGWFREQAQQLFDERLPHCCALFPELALPPLRLRKMRRRWGSCSRRGVVTLNTELVKLPLSLIDYVIVHELCHLYEFNHGPRFYRRLAQVMPDWRQREAMLKQF
jgi:predicted metal-dependent hydrolase